MTVNSQFFCSHVILLWIMQLLNTFQWKHLQKEDVAVNTGFLLSTQPRFTACVLSSVLPQKGFPTEFIWIKRPFCHYDYGFGAWPTLHAFALLLPRLYFLLWTFSKRLIHPKSQRNPLMYGNISLCCTYQSQPAALCSSGQDQKRLPVLLHCVFVCLLFLPFLSFNSREVRFKGSFSS